ncbi:MAG: GNAT family N-acetyltransferase [bacterium]|nr:GNAT family N-acetyltransferase [bacterium]
MFTVRLAYEGDIPQIKKISNQNRRFLGFTVQAIWRSSITRKELYVATSDKNVIGFIRWYLRKDGWTTVYELAVDEGYRRQGIGKKLMEVAGMGPVKLKCHSANPAKSFYRALGFEIQSTEISKTGKPIDFLTRLKAAG